MRLDSAGDIYKELSFFSMNMVLQCLLSNTASSNIVCFDSFIEELIIHSEVLNHFYEKFQNKNKYFGTLEITLEGEVLRKL